MNGTTRIEKVTPRELRRFRDLEARRLQILGMRRGAKVASLLIGMIVFGIVIFMIGEFFGYGFFAFYISIGVACGVGVFGYFRRVADDSRVFSLLCKTEVIAALLEEMALELRYDAQKGIALSTFEGLGWAYGRVDRYTTQDAFSGDVGDTGVLFAEVHAERMRGKRKGGWMGLKSGLTLFRGVIFIADFHKHFRSPVMVEPAGMGEILGSVGRGLRRMVASSLQLENPEFNRAFVVIAEDPVEVRYLLTPDMQERLLELRERFGRGVRFAFRDSCLIAALPGNKDKWEISLDKPVDCRLQRNRLVEEINTYVGLVEALNLNTRIWSKE